MGVLVWIRVWVYMVHGWVVGLWELISVSISGVWVSMSKSNWVFMSHSGCEWV